MAPHSSILAWKTHGRWSLVGSSPWDHKESDHTKSVITKITRLSDFTSLQSLVAQTVKNLPAIQETRFHPWVRKIPLQKGMAT